MERYRVHQPAGVAVELLRIFSVGLIFVLTDHIFFFVLGVFARSRASKTFNGIVCCLISVHLSDMMLGIFLPHFCI